MAVSVLRPLVHQTYTPASDAVQAGKEQVVRTGPHAVTVDMTLIRSAYTPDTFQVREGDPCPRCGGTLRLARGMVVGHTYQLGTRYSKPLKAMFVDEDGTEQPYQMGCYGIGLTRIVAAAAEQFNDDAGLKLPKALAPYQSVIIPTNMDLPAVVQTSERLYEEMNALGLDVVLDDREESAGVKFADADLMGFPLQVVIGKRGMESGTVDLKVRATGQRTKVPLPDVVRDVQTLLASAP